MPKEDQGDVRGRYSLIPRVLVFLFHDDQILLIRGAPTKRLWADRYNGIGGHVEKGEDILSAARRELEEESGLTNVDLHLCGTVTIDTGEEVGICIFIFAGEDQGGEVRSSGEGRVEWISVDIVDQIPTVEDIPFLIRQCLTARDNNLIFAAHYSYDEAGKLVISLGS